MTKHKFNLPKPLGSEGVDKRKFRKGDRVFWHYDTIVPDLMQSMQATVLGDAAPGPDGNNYVILVDGYDASDTVPESKLQLIQEGPEGRITVLQGDKAYAVVLYTDERMSPDMFEHWKTIFAEQLGVDVRVILAMGVADHIEFIEVPK